MAAHALAAGRKAQTSVRNPQLPVERGVALQAKLSPFAPHQQHSIRAAVRIVADDATFNFHRRMLEDVRPALLHVALNTGFPTRFVQTGPVEGAVRRVAIGTLHQAFRHAMMNRQGELGLNGAMAGETECRLGLLQQTVVQPADFVRQARRLEKVALRVAEISFALILDCLHEMSGVAFVARHPMRNVRRVFEEFLLLAAGVAQEAVGRVLFRVGAKMKDGILLQSGRDLGVDAEREDGLLLERPRDLALVALRRLYGVRVAFPGP